MNPYYYIFYKLNQFLNKKGNNEWGPIGAITLFVGWNITIIYIKLFHITQENSQGKFKIILIIILSSLFVVNSILFLNKKRIDKIFERYQNESKMRRTIGNVLIILYVLFSLGLIVFV